jgi:hypothetical protein
MTTVEIKAKEKELIEEIGADSILYKKPNNIEGIL